MAALAHLLLGHADGGDLRHRIDAVGKELGRRPGPARRRRGRRRCGPAPSRSRPGSESRSRRRRRRCAARRSGRSSDRPLMRPRESASRPQASRPRVSIAPTRPAANSTMSAAHLRGRRRVCTTQSFGRSAMRRPSTAAAEPQRDAAIAQIVHELVDRVRGRRSRSSRSAGSSSVTVTSSALKMVAYSMPMTLAPTTARLARQAGRSRISSLSSTRLASKAMCEGR